MTNQKITRQPSHTTPADLTLLSAAHDALRAAGCRRAHLYTHEDNQRALAVYASAGYRPDGTTRESTFRQVRIRELRLEMPL